MQGTDTKATGESPPLTPRGGNLLPPLAFAILSFLLYAGTLRHAFVQDDKPLVSENRLVQENAGLRRIFTSSYWPSGGPWVPELYRPLVVTTFVLNHVLGGGDPLGYHLVNLLLHAWVCWLVFRVAQALSGNRALAWSAGLLFTVHPIHTEAVAPVVGRSELLAAGFFLWALLLDFRSQEPGSRRIPLLLAAVGCYLAALLSKENAVALPGVLLTTDLLLAGPRRSRFGGRRRLFDYALYLLVTLLYLGVRLSVLGALARSDIQQLDNPLVSAEAPTAFLTALITAGKALGLLVWPAHLAADYSFRQIPPASGITDPRLVASAAGLVCALALALWGWRRSRMTAWSVLFYACAVLPVSNLFFRIGTIFAERLLYLPSVGFCVLLATGIEAVRRRRPRLVPLLLGALLLAGSARTVARTRIWRDAGTFARATAADSPGSAKAQHNLGVFLEDHGEIRRAEEAYRRASELDPGWADAHFNLAGALARLGRPEEAIAAYGRAIDLRPDVIRYYANLGHLLQRSAQPEEALALYREVLRTRGDAAPIYNNLGATLESLARTEEAAESYRKAVSLKPADAEYLANLGRCLARIGKREESLATLRAAVRLAPGAKVRASLGLALLEAGSLQEAIAQLQLAVRLDPGDASHHFNLARALDAGGASDAALLEYREALKTSPDAAPVLRNLGLLLTRKGERGEAAALLRRAAALTPGGLDPEARAVLEGLQ